jgi:hypothetical protein
MLNSLFQIDTFQIARLAVEMVADEKINRKIKLIHYDPLMMYITERSTQEAPKRSLDGLNFRSN